MSDTNQIIPINWTNASGDRNTKIDAITTELVKQAHEGDFRKYGRSDMEKAVRVMAEVGDPDTIDGYIEDVCGTGAIKPVAGEYYVKEPAINRYVEERT